MAPKKRPQKKKSTKKSNVKRSNAGYVAVKGTNFKQGYLYKVFRKFYRQTTT